MATRCTSRSITLGSPRCTSLEVDHARSSSRRNPRGPAARAARPRRLRTCLRVWCATRRSARSSSRPVLRERDRFGRELPVEGAADATSSMTSCPSFAKTMRPIHTTVVVDRPVNAPRTRSKKPFFFSGSASGFAFARGAIAVARVFSSGASSGALGSGSDPRSSCVSLLRGGRAHQSRDRPSRAAGGGAGIAPGRIGIGAAIERAAYALRLHRRLRAEAEALDGHAVRERLRLLA